MPERFSPFRFPIDHIIARQHHGKSTSQNLALACTYCNYYKGPNLSGIDPATGRVHRLFNPRRDAWSRHFKWNGVVVVGLTAIGRATIDVLQINHTIQLSQREALREDGALPFET